MSAIIWQIRRGDRFIAEQNGVFFFVDIHWKGLYRSSEKLAKTAIANLESQGITGLVVYKSSEQEYTEGIASTTTKYAIQLDSIAFGLGLLGYSIPTMSQLNKNLKNFLLNTSKKIKDINPHFKEFIRKKEDDTDHVQGDYLEMIEEISKIELYECKRISEIIRAYRKDSSSIIGIANKINKNNNSIA